MRGTVALVSWALLGCAGAAPVVAHPVSEPIREPEPLVTPASTTCLEIPSDYVVGCEDHPTPTRSPAEMIAALAAHGTRPRPAPPAPHDELVPRPLDLEEATLATDLRAYRCTRAADDPERAPATYRLAQIYYEADQWPPAYFLFDEVAMDPHAEDLATYAANLALDSLNLQLQRSAGAAREDCIARFGPAVARYHARFCEPSVADAELCDVLERLAAQIAARSE